MYQLFVFNKNEFVPNHYEKMEEYHNYEHTFTFSSTGDFDALLEGEQTRLGTKTTDETLKIYMFKETKGFIRSWDEI
jgi:hypothetical protein